MTYTKSKTRHTGELITAAIWNTDVVSNTLLVGESGPELIVPFSFQEVEVVECQFCGQLNKVDMDKLYRGCGACGGMFSVEQFKAEGKRANMCGPLSHNTTHPTPPSPGDSYWLIGSSELGKTTTLGF